MQFQQKVSRCALAALALALLSSCGDSGRGHESPTPAKTSNPVTSYSITAHVAVEGHPEQSGWVHVPPMDLDTWNNGAQAKSGAANSATETSSPVPGPQAQVTVRPGLHVEATVRRGDGGVEETNQTDAVSNYAPGWSLLYWATTACYTASDPAKSLASLEPGLYVSNSPWSRHSVGSARDYYVFGAFGAGNSGESFSNPDGFSCDTVLGMQETLLCAADHLAQLGDSPGTVSWSGSDGKAASTSITVTIPPQRSDDVFIARDMALNALAHVLRLDTISRTFHHVEGSAPYDSQSTCVQEYSGIAKLGASPTSYVQNLFNTVPSSTPNGVEDSTYFDPTPLTHASTAENFKAAAVRRLTRKAAALSAAVRLTKDLVERSVQADISGAQQRLSASSDYLAGAREAWGV